MNINEYFHVQVYLIESNVLILKHIKNLENVNKIIVCVVAHILLKGHESEMFPLILLR